jgi:hypothetical protein
MFIVTLFSLKFNIIFFMIVSLRTTGTKYIFSAGDTDIKIFDSHRNRFLDMETFAPEE